jgi:hypothetical protein
LSVKIHITRKEWIFPVLCKVKESEVVLRESGSGSSHLTQLSHSWLACQEKGRCAPTETGIQVCRAGKKWKPPKCPSTEECINKMWESYNGMLFGKKRNKVLTCAVTQGHTFYEST